MGELQQPAVDIAKQTENQLIGEQQQPAVNKNSKKATTKIRWRFDISKETS